MLLRQCHARRAPCAFPDTNTLTCLFGYADLLQTPEQPAALQTRGQRIDVASAVLMPLLCQCPLPPSAFPSVAPAQDPGAPRAGGLAMDADGFAALCVLWDEAVSLQEAAGATQPPHRWGRHLEAVLLAWLEERLRTGRALCRADAGVHEARAVC
jgi:hypothetical protein